MYFHFVLDRNISLRSFFSFYLRRKNLLKKIIVFSIYFTFQFPNRITNRCNQFDLIRLHKQLSKHEMTDELDDVLDPSLEAIGAGDFDLDVADDDFGGFDVVKSISEKEHGATLDTADLEGLFFFFVTRFFIFLFCASFFFILLL